MIAKIDEQRPKVPIYEDLPYDIQREILNKAES